MSVPPGSEARRLRVTLSKKGIAILRKKRRLSAAMVITVKRGGATITTTGTTLQLRRPRR